jgi:hypothetical protein
MGANLRIFQTRWFAKFARKEKIEVPRLQEAIERAELGKIDAELGGNLIKQRVARRGEGRSGGYRTLIAFRTPSRSIFLYGFAKNEKENISDEELDDLKKLSKLLLSYDDGELEKAIAAQELIEVPYGDENKI